MNKYFIIASFGAFIAWSGFMYFEGYTFARAVCTASDEKHDLAQSAVTIEAQQA